MKSHSYSRMLDCYRQVKTFVTNCGYENEIKWQDKVRFNDISESDFLREIAWVILCSGMREAVVRKYFRDISFCFLEWESSEKIVEMRDYCIENAGNYFGHFKKLEAIVSAAEKIHKAGFQKIKSVLFESPIETLKTFSFIGPTTAYHLAKNLGLPFAKADRHLFRLSSALGYSDVQDFCNNIAYLSGDSIQVVDIVVWRFATLRSDYISVFKNTCAGLLDTGILNTSD